MPGVAQRVSRGIVLLFMTATLEGVSGQQHDPAAIYSRERQGTIFTGGWVCHRVGPDGQRISFLSVFDPRPCNQ